jgi:hypothetical protein
LHDNRAKETRREVASRTTVGRAVIKAVCQTHEEEEVMKAMIDKRSGQTLAGRRLARRGRLTPLVRASLVLAAAVVLCLATAGVAAASFTETGHQAAVAPEPGAVPQTFQEWKYGAHTLGQVPAVTYVERKYGAHAPGDTLIPTSGLIPAGAEQAKGTSVTPWLIGASLAAAAVVCAALLFFRRRHAGGRPAAAAPLASIGTDREHPKAA